VRIEEIERPIGLPDRPAIPGELSWKDLEREVTEEFKKAGYRVLKVEAGTVEGFEDLHVSDSSIIITVTSGKQRTYLHFSIKIGGFHVPVHVEPVNSKWKEWGEHRRREHKWRQQTAAAEEASKNSTLVAAPSRATSARSATADAASATYAAVVAAVPERLKLPDALTKMPDEEHLEDADPKAANGKRSAEHETEVSKATETPAPDAGAGTVSSSKAKRHAHSAQRAEPTQAAPDTPALPRKRLEPEASQPKKRAATRAPDHAAEVCVDGEGYDAVVLIQPIAAPEPAPVAGAGAAAEAAAAGPPEALVSPHP
jgi:hypothetical protein